jgi:hypothetical protein
MPTAFDILNMATRREAEELAQARSDYAEQIRVRNLQGGEMSGGFGNAQSTRMESEYREASAEQQQNAKLKMALLKQQQEAQRKAEEDAARARTLGMITGGLSTAASFIPGVGPAIGAGIGVLGNIATQAAGGDAVPVDYNALYQGIDKMQKKKNFINPDTTWDNEFLQKQRDYRMESY